MTLHALEARRHHPKAGVQVFDLAYLPPSTNALYANVPGKGRRKTDRYREWLNAVGWDVNLAKPKKIIGAYSVTIIAERSNVRRDLDNIAKPISDLLVKHGVVEDDRHVVEITLAWGQVKGCRVYVEPASPAKAERIAEDAA